MKLIKKTLIFLALTVFFCSASVFAENNVSKININVLIADDGSARVVQQWKGKFDEKTENYIPVTTEDIAVSDFSVSDENGEYIFVDDWNTDWSFEEKAGKCGIVETENGIELCFGISEYGEKEYTIEYTVEDFVKGYTDYDGTNFMFINPNMSTFPTDGRVIVATENGTYLNEENSAVWSFGYDGDVFFQSGRVVAKTDKKLSGDNSMIVMLRLDKGIVFPRTQENFSFETVKEKAFEHSDYEEKVSLFTVIFGIIISVVFAVFLIFLFVSFLKRKKEIRKFYKNADYFRDVPNGGKIDVSYFLTRTFDVAKEPSLIIGSLILAMINDGSLVPEIEEKSGIFGKTKETVNLKLVKEPQDFSKLKLYKLLSASAGEDKILQEKELEKYAYKHPERINEFIDGVKENGENEFISSGGYFQTAGNRIKDLSEKGKEELSRIMGLKKFLEDFTLIAERSIAETEIWKDYLIYAALFGIGERVIEQMKEVYPEKIPEIESYNRNVVIAAGYYHGMYSSSRRGMQAKRAAGAGGRASFGGGGGFSGGGSGGGSR